MAKNIDFMNFDKAMSERVSEFMNTQVWGIVIRKRAEKDIKTIQANIERYEQKIFSQPNGSTLIEEYASKIRSLKGELKDAEEVRDKKLSEQANFEYSEADLALYKGYKDAKTYSKLSEVVREWFKAVGDYEIEIGTQVRWEKKELDFIKLFIDAMGGRKSANARTIITSDGTIFTAKRSKNDVLKVFYGLLAEVMLAKGTLKATEIPEDIRAEFAPKSKK